MSFFLAEFPPDYVCKYKQPEPGTLSRLAQQLVQEGCLGVHIFPDRAALLFANMHGTELFLARRTWELIWMLGPTSVGISPQHTSLITKVSALYLRWERDWGEELNVGKYEATVDEEPVALLPGDKLECGNDKSFRRTLPASSADYSVRTPPLLGDGWPVYESQSVPPSWARDDDVQEGDFRIIG